MYKLLGGLKEYFKFQDIQTDNAVFRLHNVFTTVLLLTCSLVITATQYVGTPISCIGEEPFFLSMKNNIINNIVTFSY